jgi:hypothetical protein
MCSWVDFTILMATLLDFLAQHGWVLRRARGWRDRLDIVESVKSLNDLEAAWYALVVPDDGPKLRDDLVDQYMQGWESLLSYMPDDVQAAWNTRKLARPLRPTPAPPVIARSELCDEAISAATPNIDLEAI